MNVGIRPFPVSAQILTMPVAERLHSVDMLRGGIMILMALDHVRDYVSNAAIDPLNLQQTWPALFFTRWITHLCAPLFMFLAGTGAFLSLSRGKTRGDLAKFLVTRGLFLVVAENTIMQLAWIFTYNPLPIWAGTLWALGWSMVALAGMVYLPRSLLIGISGTMVLLHNTLDGFRAQSWGDLRWIWGVLHEQGVFGALFVIYPLVPWIGVIGLGYAFGGLLRLEPEPRRRVLYALGGAMVVVFVVLRWTNLYGDPRPWQQYPAFSWTVMSFLNCEKYPPSLLYLLMTIGPGILVMPVLEGISNRVSGWVLVFGRVPMFFYLIHVFAIHALACGLAAAAGKPIPFQPVWGAANVPPNWGFQLWVVYVVWIFVVAALYPLCRWYADLKTRKKAWWMGYI